MGEDGGKRDWKRRKDKERDRDSYKCDEVTRRKNGSDSRRRLRVLLVS